MKSYFPFIFLLLVPYTLFAQDCLDNDFEVELREMVHVEKPLLALGFFTKSKFDATPLLSRFVSKMGERYPHKILMYHGLESAKIAKLNEYNPMETIVEAMNTLETRSGGKKFILFNLDNFNAAQSFKNGKPPLDAWTAREAEYILNHEKLFKSTKWYREGKELTPDQVRMEFEPYFNATFSN